MNIFKNLFQKKSIRTFDDLFESLLVGRAAKSGITVNETSILQFTTAQSCVRLIAEDIAKLPLKVFKSRRGGGADIADNHPLYDLLKTKPNDEQTSFDFREQIATHLTVDRNAYVYINRLGERIIDLQPILPGAVEPFIKQNGEKRYKVLLNNGTTDELTSREIWHLKGLSWNGTQGLSGIKLLKEAVGLALALETHGSKMFANGATVGGLLSTEQQLDEKQRKALREAWESRHAGIDNAYKTAVLWGGMKWTPLATGNDSAQFLQSRAFQVREVCRGFKIYPIMVGESETVPYATAEQMFLAHEKITIDPWLVKIEQSADAFLLTKKERSEGYFVKFNRNALMAMTAKDRAEYLYRMYMMGAVNANEIREFDEMNPYENGNIYFSPSNMMALELVKDLIKNPAGAGNGN